MVTTTKLNRDAVNATDGNNGEVLQWGIGTFTWLSVIMPKLNDKSDISKGSASKVGARPLL
jgi:hypothetical protein